MFSQTHASSYNNLNAISFMRTNKCSLVLQFWKVDYRVYTVALPAPEDGHHITDDLVLLVHGQIGGLGSLGQGADPPLI